MKWFNKISKWFKAEEEYEIKEIILEDDEQLDINSLQEKGIKLTTRGESQFVKNNDMESGTERRENTVVHGEIDAKISYQYPKGNFRFPVIPDYEPRERRRPKQSSHLNVQPTNAERKTVSAVPRHSSSPSMPEEERKRRPFSPTQIPSPVYGFQKRPNKKEEEERLEREIPIQSVAEINSDIPAIYRKEVAPVLSPIQKIEEGRKNPLLDEIKHTTDEVKLETAVRIDSEVETRNDDQEVVTCKEDETIGEVVQTVESNRAEQTPVQSVEVAQEEVATSVAFVSNAEETFNPIISMESHDLATMDEDVHTSTDLESEQQSESDSQNLQHTMEVSEKTDEDHSEIEQATNEMSAQEEVAPTLEVERDEQVDNKTLSSTESTKRNPIPFNVVMLRQDKLKMQNRLQPDEKKTVNIVDQMSEEERIEIIEPVVDEVIGDIDDVPYYHFPSIELLSQPVSSENDDEWLDQQGFMLNETLLNFNVRAKVVNITQGPAVTQFEVQPEPGVKVNKITNLTDDIKLCLAAQDIRMEAPIPGKHTIGIEIPNRKSRAVPLREILESDAFVGSESPLTVALGLDITGAPVVTDLRKMPHGLIAGATGSGKSVCINTMLVSLLYKATPQDVKLLLIDPKVVELAPYNNIPHLVSPVITDVKAATAALKWAVEEMDRRYELFAHTGVRDLQRFNKKAEEAGEYAKKLPYIVIIIDELADLMMMSPAEVEESICRIAQKARACGIHLVLATQRPSVDVITGLIKANIPTRIAFSVSSQVDSRTIIDTNGADKLLGRGDMLFLENGSSKTVRLQGTFVSDEEIEEVVDFVKKEQEPQYLFLQEDLLSKAQMSDERDELFLEACEFVIYQNAASTSSLQRRFHIGYNRAARLMDMLEKSGIISEARGSKPRDVLMTETEMQEWLQAQQE